MESAYRLWVKQKKEGLNPEDLNELFRELQTALGTAKWQVCFLYSASKIMMSTGGL